MSDPPWLVSWMLVISFVNLHIYPNC